MKYVPRQPVHNDNVSRTSPLREFAFFCGVLILLVICLYTILGLVAEQLAVRISPEQEAKLASYFAPMIPDHPRPETAPLQALADSVAGCLPQLPYPLTVHVSENTETVNAMALPGGHIVVTSALLRQVGSENELAFILGHEIGHFENRDHLRGLGRALVLASLSAALFRSDSLMGRIIGSGMTLTEFGFSRSQELSADQSGVDALLCLYGHAGGAADFFVRMAADADPGKFGQYFTTHPENARRIKNIETYPPAARSGTGRLRPWPGPDL